MRMQWLLPNAQQIGIRIKLNPAIADTINTTSLLVNDIVRQDEINEANMNNDFLLFFIRQRILLQNMGM
jgi:hypothetical protein